ncbi:hypothetical protein CISG_02300 [Coccidioides immitis RMSCC 3703]|uniref:Ribosomal RNA methyltransferase FtsJ domain-containing protein n=1 Tax=Coccidioides immitis RMSCC 3703 TaxID=454286 RepID=A0A0J8R5R6_COCIT|nr:hypothetical protein CISG_02300 [Coccidioides immitis RMSCC 3703]
MAQAKKAMSLDGSASDQSSIQALANKAPCPNDQESKRANGIVIEYLLQTAPEFRELTDLRQKVSNTSEQQSRVGWSNPAGDLFFQKQRQTADNADGQTVLHFYDMMKKIGRELHLSTDAFRISGDIWRGRILDMCMAPGGFSRGTQVKYQDITMFAADMGVTDIPKEHPDAANFLPRQLDPREVFDLVICDGQVLRTHDRAAYREEREARRLTLTQLALGVEHVRHGGTIVALLHKIEAWDTVSLLYTFSKFSSVQVFKPQKFHAKRSSFYMVATNIQSQHDEAILAIRKWKTLWRLATFGTDEQYGNAVDESETGVEAVLEKFGLELVRLARDIWNTQARALAKAPFIKAQ